MSDDSDDDFEIHPRRRSAPQPAPLTDTEEDIDSEQFMSDSDDDFEEPLSGARAGRVRRARHAAAKSLVGLRQGKRSKRAKRVEQGWEDGNIGEQLTATEAEAALLAWQSKVSPGRELAKSGPKPTVSSRRTSVQHYSCGYAKFGCTMR
jgi:hypothetical protein